MRRIALALRSFGRRAVISRRIASSGAGTASASGKRPRRRKLPPTIQVSDSAVSVIGRLLNQKPNVEGVKLSFDGITYKVDYVMKDDVHTLDERIVLGDATVFVDWKSFGILVGRTLDFDGDKSEFKVVEPDKDAKQSGSGDGSGRSDSAT